MGDGFSSGGSGAVGSSSGGGDAPEGHLFKLLSECQLKVEFQHNGHDCGLYMLQYVKMVATCQPDLLLHAPRHGIQHKLNWRDYSSLRLEGSGNWDDLINTKRFHLARDIKNEGKEQAAKKEAKMKASAESAAATTK
jgi:hypothetical protein